jgi:hypothetical protein
VIWRLFDDYGRAIVFQFFRQDGGLTVNNPQFDGLFSHATGGLGRRVWRGCAPPYGRTAIRGARQSGVTGFLRLITERPLIAGLGGALVKVTLSRFHYTAAASRPSTETLGVDEKVVRRKLIQRPADWFPVKVHL